MSPAPCLSPYLESPPLNLPGPGGRPPDIGRPWWSSMVAARLAMVVARHGGRPFLDPAVAAFLNECQRLPGPHFDRKSEEQRLQGNM